VTMNPTPPEPRPGADVPEDVRHAVADAANRLHHLSMRYAGALVEAAAGYPVGMLARSRPGLREVRDPIALVLLTRAGTTRLTRLCLDAGLFTAEAFARQQAEQYDWFARAKAEFLGVETTDAGLVFKNPDR